MSFYYPLPWCSNVYRNKAPQSTSVIQTSKMMPSTTTAANSRSDISHSQISQSQQPQEYIFSKRVRRSEAVLRAAADCVSRGLTFQNASEQFNIPISTIRFFMARKGILPRRRRGRTTQIDRSTEIIRSCSSPEPPYLMQNYKLPSMLALNDDDDPS